MPGVCSSTRFVGFGTLRGRATRRGAPAASCTPAAPSSVAWWIFEYQRDLARSRGPSIT